jgi:hypothetical protein
MSSVENLSKHELLSLLNTAGQVSAEIDQEKLVYTILDTACRMTNSPDGIVKLRQNPGVVRKYPTSQWIQLDTVRLLPGAKRVLADFEAQGWPSDCHF